MRHYISIFNLNSELIPNFIGDENKSLNVFRKFVSYSKCFDIIVKILLGIYKWID